MNKRILALFLAVGVIAGSDAFASRARLLVLGSGDADFITGGSGDGGSLYVDDAYNMFYNPSYVNDYKDWGIIEKAKTTAVAGTSRAQGGFVTSLANLNVGVFFNRSSYLSSTTQGGLTGAANTRPIELFVGGDAGVKWGLGLGYSRFKNATGTASDLRVSLGAQFDGFDPFFKIAVFSKDTASTASTENKHQHWMGGFRYHWGEWVPYAAVRRDRNLGVTNTNAWGIGLGRNTKVAEGVKLNYGVGFWRNAAAKGTALANTNRIPVDVSIEGDATSWLTLRAGLSHRIWDQTSRTTNTDSTTGRLGATFNFGKLAMDWAVGSGTAGAESLDNSSFGFDGGLFTAASLQYRW